MKRVVSSAAFCGSDDVEQQMSLFYVVTSKKSA